MKRPIKVDSRITEQTNLDLIIEAKKQKRTKSGMINYLIETGLNQIKMKKLIIIAIAILGVACKKTEIKPSSDPAIYEYKTYSRGSHVFIETNTGRQEFKDKYRNYVKTKYESGTQVQVVAASTLQRQTEFVILEVIKNGLTLYKDSSKVLVQYNFKAD